MNVQGIKIVMAVINDRKIAAREVIMPSELWLVRRLKGAYIVEFSQ